MNCKEVDLSTKDILIVDDRPATLRFLAKIVNDSLGHLVGDVLLFAIARRLEGSLNPVDSLARLGGNNLPFF